ncbi:MAG: PDZ domain-containing protein [Bacteroidetes bacterium]|nr:PDZ domain-containing protein [Bacteroidota bacterium]
MMKHLAIGILAFTSILPLAHPAPLHAQKVPAPLSADSLLSRSLDMFDLPPFEWDGAPEPLRPRLGIYLSAIPADSLALIPGLAGTTNPLRIWHVMPHWSADEAGVLINDVLLSIDGRPIGDSLYQGEEYVNVLARDHAPGDTIRMTIVRGGVRRDIPVPLAAPVRVPMPVPAAPAALGPIRTGTWLQKTIATNALADRARSIQKQMRIVADQDFCTVPFAGRPNPWRLGAVTYLHHNPTRVGAYSRWLVDDCWRHVRAGVGLSGAVEAAARHLDVQLDAHENLYDRPHVPSELDGFMRTIQIRLDKAYAPVRKDLGEMTKSLAHLLDMDNNWEEELDSTSDPVARRALRVAHEKRLAALFTRADSVDLLSLTRGGMMAASLADSAWLVTFARALETAPGGKPAKPVKMDGVEGEIVMAWTTPLGRYVIGGKGANHYTGNFRCIIDLGGDDVYDLSPAEPGTVRFIADLAGNDVYRTPAAGIASGIGCVDVLADLGGDDTYRSAYYSEGAGLLGVGLLADFGGNDTYISHWCSQGAAFLGIGLLCDWDGSDSYSADVYSQGFGYVHGFGAILERAGNDSYRAGWKYPDSRIPNRAHLAMSQGFGFGMRPWSIGVGADGGIGVLSDLAGDDLYASDLFSQGGSYWYSLGILHDEQGADRYTAGQYSQGSGIHLSFAALLDNAGDDMYDAYAGLEQGNAHDWSSGCLEDAGGNDTYRGSGSSQGSALTVSFAWLLDASGDDQYYARLADTALSQGGGNTIRARRAGSLGMLIDLGGGDDYYVEPRERQGTLLIKGNGLIFDDGPAPK